MIEILNRRECFFDDYLIDTERTTAEYRVHEPVRRDVVMVCDEPWEGDGSNYHNFFYDDGIYRVYYLGWRVPGTSGIRVCYAESRDGIHWVKPKLGICEFEGSRENNILIDSDLFCQVAGDERFREIDNFMVFRDDNPACPPEERYKAVFQKMAQEARICVLGYATSADGIHFVSGGVITDKGAFDTLNVAFWDAEAGKYRCYFRSDHAPGTTEALDWFTFAAHNEADVRDIRYMESEDFVHWSEPCLLDFGEVEDVPLYTNVVQPYYRAPHMLIGFPTRYNYRREWTANYEELCGKEYRLERMKMNPRYGLVTTDSVFICSRDGLHFKRHDDAFTRPGPENGKNWVYGDCYLCRGMVETPSPVEGESPEMSLYEIRNHWIGPSQLVRYALRLDGFVSLHAGAKGGVIFTKPFVFEGDELHVNFETDAWGGMYVTLIDQEGNRYESTETFGNATDRRVRFLDEGAVARLSGTPVTMEIRMKGSDIYSMQFR